MIVRTGDIRKIAHEKSLTLKKLSETARATRQQDSLNIKCFSMWKYFTQQRKLGMEMIVHANLRSQHKTLRKSQQAWLDFVERRAAARGRARKAIKRWQFQSLSKGFRSWKLGVRPAGTSWCGTLLGRDAHAQRLLPEPCLLGR